jgi:hypothetical protein
MVRSHHNPKTHTVIQSEDRREIDIASTKTFANSLLFLVEGDEAKEMPW